MNLEQLESRLAETMIDRPIRVLQYLFTFVLLGMAYVTHEWQSLELGAVGWLVAGYLMYGYAMKGYLYDSLWDTYTDTIDRFECRRQRRC